jgi:hypothetical protein
MLQNEQMFAMMNDMNSVTLHLPSADDVAGLDGASLDAVLWELEVARRQLTAAIVAVVDRCERTAHYLADGHRTVKAWNSAVTNSSPGESSRRHKVARMLRDLPIVGDELAAGTVGVEQVVELAVLHANPRCVDQLPDSEQILLEVAKSLEFVDFRTVTKRWEQLADAEGAHRQHELTHECRNAALNNVGTQYVWSSSHGVIQGAAMLAIFDAFCQAEFEADWAITKQQHGDAACAALLPRTDRQRRADALVNIFETAATATGSGQLADPVVNLLIDNDQFEQYLREQIDGTPVAIDPNTVGDRRCETIGGVPVDPRQAVALAIVGQVRRIVVNTAGVVTDAGRLRRLFTGSLREALIAISPRCIWLGCTIRAAISQIDDLQPHSRGGPTSSTNAAVVCEHHNLFKHNRGFTPQRQPDGTWQITRPDRTHIRVSDAA